MGTALLVSLAGGAALVPASAGAAEKASAEVSIPNPGQLAAARLEFKIKGTAKPKVKLKAKNAAELPDGVAVAGQAAYEKPRKKARKKRKGRAVVLLGIANASTGGAATAAATETVDIQAAATGQSISSIKFEDLPGRSRTFLSVLGPEPQAERDLAQSVFNLPDKRIPADPQGGLDLPAATKSMGLKRTGRPRVLSEEVEEFFKEQLISSAIAAAIGPPGAVDANVWEYTTGLTPPIPFQATVSPSPTNPRVLFARSDWTAGIYGVQVSAAGDNPLQFTAAARCQDDAFSPGTLRPLAEDSPRVVFSCLFDDPTQRLFADIPFAQPVSAGERAALALPYTISDYDGSRSLPGEALSGSSAFGIKY